MHSERRFSKKRIAVRFCFALLLMLSACRRTEGNTTGDPSDTAEIKDANAGEPMPEKKTNSSVSSNEMEGSLMELTVNDQTVSVLWENNESVEALRKLASENPVVVEMSKYGGFEQVGPLGTSLPKNDTDTTTRPGDIVLYSGNQIVVFYGSNTWAYTRLGKISGLSEPQLKELLGKGDVTITIQLPEAGK